MAPIADSLASMSAASPLSTGTACATMLFSNRDSSSTAGRLARCRRGSTIASRAATAASVCSTSNPGRCFASRRFSAKPMVRWCLSLNAPPLSC